MKARAKLFVSGLFVALAALVCLATISAAPMGSTKLDWTLHLNETRGPIRSADVSTPLGKIAVSEILGGPTSGSDNAYLIYTRMPSGAHGPPLFTLPAEDIYVVLSGKMTVQIGTDKFVAGPLTAVIIPANIPHEVWNAEAVPEAHFEAITSGNPDKDLSRDLKSMLKPAHPIKVENAAQYIREIKIPEPSELKPGLNGRIYTDRTMGSGVQLRFDSTLPGSGGAPSHIHRHEQVYFMVDGETTLTYGMDSLKARKNDIVIVPPGVVHSSSNQGTEIERHIELNVPEPEKQPYDFEFKYMGPLVRGNRREGSGSVAATTSNASAQSMSGQKIVTLDMAQTMAQAAMAQCHADGFKVTVLVVDSLNMTKVMLRDDGIAALTTQLATMKATSTMLFDRPSGPREPLPPGTPVPPPMIPGTINAKGAVPIQANGVTIGAIAVSGTPSGDKDAACANAGLAKVADLLK